MSKPIAMLLAALLLITSAMISVFFLNKDAILASFKDKQAEAPKPQELAFTPEYLDSMKKDFEKREKELAAREEIVKKNEERLLAMDQMLKQERSKLEELRDEFRRFFEVVSSTEVKNISNLAKLYGAMKPEMMVKVLDEMDDKFAVVILSKMKPDQSAKVLGIYSSIRDGQSSINRAKRTALLTEMMKNYSLIPKNEGAGQ